MPGDLLDNRGRGDVRWSWPPIHPEGRKFVAIFAAVTETVLEPIFESFEATMDALDSRLSAGEILEIGLASIKNPVTGEPEEIHLAKPTGFTSTKAELGASSVYRFTGGFQHDHSGQYAEFAPFDYSGP